MFAPIAVGIPIIIDRGRTVRVNLFIAFVGLVGMRNRVLDAVDTKFHDF